ncbi:hypothetical protein [Gynuella sp.]|uniref:hypothetical protein n=1 Tax=Gynuella sp. TaxID=2969146 RepID=UPI003D09852C
MAYTDPDGEFVNLIVGALAGAAIDAAMQGVLIATGVQDEFKWGQVAGAAAMGVVGGGVFSKGVQLVKALKRGKIATKGVTRGSDITEDTIKAALKGDKNMASQKAVELKRVQEYYDKLSTSKAPNIKMDGNVITDGHHTYIAGKIKGQLPGVDGGVLTNAKKANVIPLSEIKTY